MRDDSLSLSERSQLREQHTVHSRTRSSLMRYRPLDSLDHSARLQQLTTPPSFWKPSIEYSWKDTFEAPTGTIESPHSAELTRPTWEEGYQLNRSRPPRPLTWNPSGSGRFPVPWTDSAALAEPLKPARLVPALRPTSSALLRKNPAATGSTHAERRARGKATTPPPIKLEDGAAAKWALWRGPELKPPPRNRDGCAGQAGAATASAQPSVPAVLYDSLGVAIPSCSTKPTYRVLCA